MRIAPRPYQKMAVKAALKGLRSRSKRALVVLATGLGKTLTAAFITREYRPKRVLFLVHNNFILDHAREEFQLVFHKTSMATFNGLSRDGVASVDMVFATWQTMGTDLKLWKRDHFDLIVVDEAHHTEADTYRPVVDYFNGAKLGITATPDREDDADIRDVFGPEVINITLEEAIARGWLPRVEYHVVTDQSLDEKALQKIAAEIHEAKKRFTMTEVNRRIFIRKRDEDIARIIDGYNEKSIVFCASIQHAERMKKSLHLAATFHSGTGDHARDTWDKNQAALSALKNGTIRRICSVNAFNEGVNVPSVGLVAFCRVTGSLTIFRQQLGRGLRPGKDKLIVLDFAGNLERIQMLLEMMNKISDLHEKYTTENERTREGYGRSTFEVSGKGFEFTFSDQVVDLMKVLEHTKRELYATWQEASKAAIDLGLTSDKSYERGYRTDPRLPSTPSRIYADYPGDPIFFGREYKEFYGTWQEASRAARAQGLKDKDGYEKNYKKISGLPSSPRTYYADFPGWRVFLNKRYTTWQEAGKAATALGARNLQSYKCVRKADPLLTSSPARTYKDFPGWRQFLGRTGNKLKDSYNTWEEASKAAQDLGIKTWAEYRRRRVEDPLLPAKPERMTGFPGFSKFLGNV